MKYYSNKVNEQIIMKPVDRESMRVLSIYWLNGHQFYTEDSFSERAGVSL